MMLRSFLKNGQESKYSPQKSRFENSMFGRLLVPSSFRPSGASWFAGPGLFAGIPRQISGPAPCVARMPAVNYKQGRLSIFWRRYRFSDNMAGRGKVQCR